MSETRSQLWSFTSKLQQKIFILAASFETRHILRFFELRTLCSMLSICGQYDGDALSELWYRNCSIFGLCTLTMMRMKAVESRQSYQYRPACPSLLMTRQSTTGISHKICHLVCWTFHWTQSNTFSRGAPREILPDSVSSPMSPATSPRNVECRTYPFKL